MISPPQSSRPIPPKRRARLLMLLALLFILYLVGRYFGVAERFDPQALRVVVGETGWLGVLIYLLLFCAGLVLSVPGIIFMVASGLAWGGFYGTLVAWVGANLAIIFSFAVVRRFNGAGFESEDIVNKYLKRLLHGLEVYPIRTIIISRFFFSTAPGLNYGFALSSVTNRQHLIGTLVGTTVPVTSIVFFSDWLAGRLF